jgi:hypothetical protein
MDIPSASVNEKSNDLQVSQAELLKIASYFANPDNSGKLENDFSSLFENTLNNPKQVASMLDLAERRNMSPQVLLSLSGRLARLEGDSSYIQQVEKLQSQYRGDVNAVMSRAHQSEVSLYNEVV